MKRVFCIILIVTAMVSVWGCSVKKERENKIRDIEYTVVTPDEMPSEIEERIQPHLDEPFRMTYADDGYLYIVRGYGTQKSSGYSVAVRELYEAEDVICIKTALIGPAQGEKITEKETYPFVAVKTEYIEKKVVYK